VIADRVIVCLASAWDYDPTSKHHVMRILSRRNRIVWVNYHGSRKPAPSASDLGASLGRLRHVARGVRRINDSMVQVTPLVIPGATTAPALWLHRRLLTMQIRRAIRAVSGDARRPVQVWTFAPDVPYLVGAFDEECFVYYCVDEYSSFAGFDRTSIVRAEAELLDKADVVITTSQALWESKRRRRADAALVRHGVAFDQFATAWRHNASLPEAVRSIPNPMFGFFGLIHHWIDIDLIATVARSRPHYQFVLIGEAKVDVRSLEALPNVHLLGRRDHHELPAYCRAFSAGLLPFTRTEMTKNVNPIKMWEYLAAGLPIVSTDLPEVRRHGWPVRIAQSAEVFAAACDEIVAEKDTLDRRAIAETVADLDWERKVEALSRIVEGRTIRRDDAAPGSDLGRVHPVHERPRKSVQPTSRGPAPAADRDRETAPIADRTTPLL
jgi:glycosyltransferase involved in cell wall biosynthesis